MQRKRKSLAVQQIPTAEKTWSWRTKESTKASVQQLVESAKFEGFVCLLIVANVILLGVEVQVTMGIPESPTFFKVAEFSFTAAFTLEIVTKVFVYGIWAFLCGESRLWNILDAVLVFAALFQAVMELFEKVAIPNFSAARIFRMFRIVRVFRILRVLKFFRPLRILIFSLVNTLKSLFWTLVLLAMIVYLFGMIFTMAVSDALSRPGLANPELVTEHFGSLWKSIVALFKAITGGMDWHVYTISLGDVGLEWAFLFMSFIAFSQIAVLNVVTGVVCQGAIESAQQDQDVVVQTHLTMKEKYVRELLTIFKDMDQDGSGSISLQEFEEHLQDPALQDYFAAMDLTVDEAWSLFKLLDSAEACVIDTEQFVSGCLKLKGTARSMDVHMLMYESRWTMKRITSLTRAMEELARSVAHCYVEAHQATWHGADQGYGQHPVYDAGYAVDL